MERKEIFAAIHRGDKVLKRDLEIAVSSLVKVKEMAESRGLTKTAERLEQRIEEIRSYKSRKKRRKYAEIQADIDKAQQLIVLFRNNREYELAAKWERIRDEYMKEWDEAALGRATAGAEGRKGK